MLAHSSLSLTICCIEQPPADGSIISLQLDQAVSGHKLLLLKATVGLFKRRLLVILLSVVEGLLIISSLLSISFLKLSI